MRYKGKDKERRRRGMSWLFGKKDKQGDKPDDGAKGGASAASADAAPPRVRLKSISIEQVSPGPVILCGLGTSCLLPPSCLLPFAFCGRVFTPHPSAA